MAAGIAVALNGTPLVTISTEGHDHIDVGAHGIFIEEEFARLSVAGGAVQPGCEKSQYLIWVDQSLSAGAEVRVDFIETAATTFAGKTIEEMYPEEIPMGPWQPESELLDGLARRAKLRDRYSLRLETPDGQKIHAQVANGAHRFRFSTFWTSFHPDIVRVSLSSTTLENIRLREQGTYYEELKMRNGQGVSLRVDG